jgi:spore germination cell wall hydrolase CwlJ-like protein
MWIAMLKENRMPKSGTIFNRIFHRNSQPINVQRVVISDAQKRIAEENKQETTFKPEQFAADLFEENLEDTPVAVFHERAVKRQGRHSAKKKQNGMGVLEKMPVIHETQRRYKNKKSFGAKLASVFSRQLQTSNDAALEFAGSNKRVGRKGRRNRKIALYAGTGIIIAALMLVIVFVPGGAAAPAEAANMLPTKAGNKSVAYAAGKSDEITPQQSEQPDVSGDASQQPDISEQPDVSEQPGISGNESSASTEPSVPVVSNTPEPTLIATTPPDKTLPPISVDREVEKFKVEAKLYYNEMGYSSNYYEYSDEEAYMLAQVIHAEARGESMKGKIAVGNVVMNRVLSRGFPGNTIKDVVTRPGQFAYNESTRPGVASKIAARNVLDLQVWVVPQNVYFFKVSNSKSNWSSHVYQFNIGAHAFYTANYSGRYRGDSIPPALYERTYKWPTIGCKPEDRVYRLQYMLNKLGYDVKADKYFGKDTKEAVMEFQKKKGLKQDGVAGPATLEALIYEFGLQNYYEKFCK